MGRGWNEMSYEVPSNKTIPQFYGLETTNCPRLEATLVTICGSRGGGLDGTVPIPNVECALQAELKGFSPSKLFPCTGSWQVLCCYPFQVLLRIPGRRRGENVEIGMKRAEQ
ncbi:hypothetical protein TURU_120299 [Turdus rufiventris]|nr:hypothetical protein TURU_120299 [Turdus rufiventris]